MRPDLWRKEFVSLALALTAAGGCGVWWMHGPGQRTTLPQPTVTGKLSEPTGDDEATPASSVVKKGWARPSSDPQLPIAAPVPETAPDRGLRTERKPALRQLADLLEATRHGMARARFDQCFERWLRTLNTSEMLMALSYLPTEGLEDAFFADLNARLIRRLSETSPNLALMVVSAMPEGAARSLASENLTVVWAGEQLPAAINWVTQLPTGLERDADLLAVAGEAVRTQPSEAARLADELPPGAARDELVSRAVGEWAVTDPRAAVSWSRSIADDTLREQALASATAAWSDRDPAAAGAFAWAELSPGRIQDDAVVGVAQRWAQQSPTAAAVWVQSFPEGALKTAAASNVASTWSRSDAPASKQWLTRVLGP